MPSFQTEERSSAGRFLVFAAIAIVIVAAAIAGYVHFATPPPAHSGRVTSLAVYPIHRDIKIAGGTTGIGGENDTYDEVIVLANLELKNTAKVPIVVQDMVADLNLPDQDSIRSTAAGEDDFQKVFVAYKDLDGAKGQPLLRGTSIAPGQQITGQAIFHYAISDKEWSARNGLTVVVSFQHQNNLILTLTGSQTASN